LRNSVSDDGEVPKQRECAKNSIDSCTKAQTQNNILYRLRTSGGERRCW